MSDYEPGATRVGGATSTGPAVRTDMADVSATMPRPVEPRPLEHRPERVTTETKASFKTTELFVYLGSVAAVIITCLYITSGKDRANVDYFRADKAILYIVFLTIGYLVSRGMAKSGSSEPYDRSPR